MNVGTKIFSLFLGLSHPFLAKDHAGKRFFSFLNFFRNFLARVEYQRNSRLNFFFLFLRLTQPILDRNNARINFLNFFTIFYLEFSSSGWVGTEFGAKIFLSFSAYLIPFYLKIMPERVFLIFWIFSLFFWEFSSPGLLRTEFRTNFFFFFPFFGLFQPVLHINNAGKGFFNFFNFFAIFFRIFLPRSSMNGIEV